MTAQLRQDFAHQWQAARWRARIIFVLLATVAGAIAAVLVALIAIAIVWAAGALAGILVRGFFYGAGPGASVEPAIGASGLFLLGLVMLAVVLVARLFP